MQTAPTAAQAIEIARAIEARGWKPTPLHVVGPDGATCSCPKGGGCGRSAGKHNIASNWQSDLRGSEIFVEMASGAPKPQGGHWPQRRKMNIGILTGTASGIMVLDIDPKDGGMESMHALLERHGQLPPTFIAQTGTGGWHFYFQMPDIDIRNSAGKIAPGVDIRANGGMVVAPGSVSYAGPYRIATDLPPAPAPDWLIDAVRPKQPVGVTGESLTHVGPSGSAGVPSPAHNPFLGQPDPTEPKSMSPASAAGVAGAHAAYERAIVQGELRKVEQLPAAGWNVPWDHTTFQVACQLVELANASWSSLTLQEAHDMFIGSCPPAESSYSPETKWASAEKTVGGKARPEPAAPRVTEDVFADNPDVGGRSPDPTQGADAHREGGASTGAYTLSDLGNADRLIFWHGDVLKYAADAGAWLTWTNGVWSDASGEVDAEAYTKSALYLAETNEWRMHSDVAPIPEEGSRAKPKSPREEFHGWMGKSQMYAKVTAAKAMARSDPRMRVRVGAFDADPMLLNTANAVVNLATGEAMPHSPEYLFRHQSPVAYDPDAECPLWEKFLARVQPDPAMRRYLQTVFGYSSTGRMDEHAFFIHVGTGNNGKTTLLEVISRVLGDYGQKLHRETLLSNQGSNGGGPTPEIARMAGARLLGASEIPAGRKLDDELVKELVGGDTQTARYLNKDPFDFTPTGKIHMLTNHLPGLESGGPGMGRRIRIVSWDVSIPEEEIDKTLKERIVMTEAAGVLNWLIRGAVAWSEKGLLTPKSITERSNEHMEEADPIWPFIRERLQLNESDSDAYETAHAEVYGSYRSWCESDGNKPMSGKAFSQAMMERLGRDIRFQHWQSRRSMFRVKVRPAGAIAGTDGFFSDRGVK